MYVTDTIAAISTPVGEGGVGVIRISGPDALHILNNIFRPGKNGGFESHRFYYGAIITPETGSVIDEVFSVYMQSPRTFTREEVVEIQCHGGTLVMQQILDLVCRHGARLAEPGEFTKRAFLNGRIDLLQAEAVLDIIRGKTEASVALAQHQREGILSTKMTRIRDSVRQALALVEAYVDFPEEDLGESDSARLIDEVDGARAVTQDLLASYAEGKVLREGVSVVIAGKPNVGKSSLLNTLLREKRAIVTAIPGTTRDLIEEVVNIRGLPVTLLDTAGICESNDPVEQEGIRLARERIALADLVLCLLDGCRHFDHDDLLVSEAVSGSNCLVLLNKADLPQVLILPEQLAHYPRLTISTLTGHGVEQLKDEIAGVFLHGKAVDSRDLVMLSHARHRDAMQRTASALDRFLSNLDMAAPHEVLALDLREALDAVGQVTGETTNDDILDLIFGQFCIGK